MSAYGASPVKRYRRTSAELEEVDEAIVAAVEADKPVTLRGVYYRVVSAGAVAKTEDGYRLIGRQLLKLRRAGRVSYGDITDGTRFLRTLKTWNGWEDALRNTAATYRRDLWHNQPAEVMIFTEKDAISGAIMPVIDRWDVPLGVLRGYSSESFSWSVAQYVCAARAGVYIYQLGDHDPSGVDAWRAFAAKVTDFARERYSDVENWLEFQRIAVTPEQIEMWNLPTRPTKRSDTRSARFAGESVEVDAIPARQLRELVEDSIVQHVDAEAYRITREAERSERDILARMAGRPV